ncbi:metalloregulator ArsR/SmtB family transcription factor [Thalassospira sp. GB04J01]|nr:metalloregulator ArsR/SmtB family transcription factor [Thalassospira sp. GB04J01]
MAIPSLKQKICFSLEVCLFHNLFQGETPQYLGTYLNILDVALKLKLLRHMPYHSNPLDLAFHALSDPTRRAVVSRLANGEASVSDLAAPFNMALPSFTQHLKVLEECGLIASEKRGRSRWCQLVPERFNEAAVWMEAERRRWIERLDRLELHLDHKDEEDGRHEKSD